MPKSICGAYHVDLKSLFLVSGFFFYTFHLFSSIRHGQPAGISYRSYHVVQAATTNPASRPAVGCDGSCIASLCQKRFIRLEIAANCGTQGQSAKRSQGRTWQATYL